MATEESGYLDEDPPFSPEDVAENAESAWGGYKEAKLPQAGDVHEPIVTGVQFKRSKNGGFPQIVLDLSDPEKDPNGEVQGRVYLTRKPGFATKMWKGGLAALGLEEPPPDADGEIRPKFTKDDFVGKLVSATVKHEEYQGENQAKYDNLQPPTAGAGSKAFGY